MKNRIIIKLLFIAVLLVALGFEGIAQFQRTDGDKIVDANGNDVLWRGMGLGGWMLQEGYMLGTHGPQHELEARIDALVGREKRDEFYEAWWANHMRKIDVDSVAAWGFNMIRLPMHYKLYTPPIEDEPVQGEVTWLDRGFTMTDSLVKWCKTNDLYLILDLHAAPGGQGENADINDYDRSKPSLWESDLNKEKTVALWRKLAERYADEPTIVAYDLINEPNWGFQNHASDPNGCAESQNTPLWNLQKDITEAIREVDNNHIVVIEGNCWGNNYAGLPQLWDDNMVISFHKYWNYENDVSAAVNMRESRGVPVWLGETGENSNTWFTNTVSALESNNIGWAWWPLKKLGLNNALEIPRNEKYQAILDYWGDNSKPKPGVQDAYDGLMELAEATKLENAIYHKDVPDALTRQPHSSETLPFVARQLSDDALVIHATDFDLGRNNYAYYDLDTADYHSSTGTFTDWNTGWSYRNDGVDIEPTGDDDEKSNGFNVGWTEPGEWMQYTLSVDSTDVYRMDMRYASQGSGQLRVGIDGAVATPSLEVSASGGWQSYATATLGNLLLESGTTKLRVYIDQGVNIGYYTLNRVGGLESMTFEGVAGNTGMSGYDVEMDLNQPADSLSVVGADGFELIVDGEVLPAVASVVDSRKIRLTVTQRMYDDNDIKIRYSGERVLSAIAGVALEEITDLTVTNQLPIHYQIPGIIQAENFFVNEGLALEETSDTGGGFNIGYTNVGDYLEYRISVLDSGTYKIESRIACDSNPGKFRLQQIAEVGSVNNETTVNVPVTGGWQDWQTIEDGEMILDKGRWVLRLTITDPEFNVNWIKFTKKKILATTTDIQELAVYPNPSLRYINVTDSPHDRFVIVSLGGSQILSGLLPEERIIDLKRLGAGMYVLILIDEQRGEHHRYKFLKRDSSYSK
ncbi:MAG: cellulase family glycosylhydrolase [Cyclobacteriaceae bacterium]